MRKANVIQIEKFRHAYETVGWIEKRSKDEAYIIWASPQNKELWIQLPTSEDAEDYPFYAQRNILMLLYILDLPENQQSIDEMISQLRGYNYKLINRIVSKSEFKSDAVPYELATLLPQKNIEAFRHFFLTRKHTSGGIPLEKFQMNHTEVGSFVIPISIAVEEDPNATIVPIKSETNNVLHEYLSMIDTLVNISPNDPQMYAKKIVKNQIDSKIVKDFLGKNGSIAKATEKYANQVKNITISSTGSPLLDFGLEKKDREFKVVDLKNISTIEDEYIIEIEKLELKSDENRVEEYQAEIDVVVDNIDRNGNVKFTVMAINGQDVKKPFKALSSELTKSRLDQFADYFKNEGAAVVIGDITKSSGRMGKVIIETVGAEREDKNTKLL